MGSQNTVNVKELHYNKILLHTPERFTQKQNFIILLILNFRFKCHYFEDSSVIKREKRRSSN